MTLAPSRRSKVPSNLSIDLFIGILKRTVLHPFVAWIIPLCLRAQLTPYTHLSFRLSVGYACLITISYIFRLVNQRFAYGPSHNVNISEKVIVITGGASGLGLLLAQVFGLHGAKVAILDVKMVKDEERGVSFYECDVGDKVKVEQTAKDIVNDLGKPDILINNASVVNGKPLLELSSEEIENSIQTNLSSSYHTTRAFLPDMLLSKAGSTIITITSALGVLTPSHLSDYSATKAGITAFHRSLYHELRSTGTKKINMVLVTLGQLNTPLFEQIPSPRQFFAPVVEANDVVKRIVGIIESGRGGEISLPAYVSWLDWYSILPVGIQNVLRVWAGIDEAMKGFQRRPS